MSPPVVVVVVVLVSGAGGGGGGDGVLPWRSLKGTGQTSQRPTSSPRPGVVCSET